MKIKYKIRKERFRKRKINLLSIELIYKNINIQIIKAKINLLVKVLKEKRL
jgi:ribosomal protein L12E/L44/L45/RPP1/RPP2